MEYADAEAKLRRVADHDEQLVEGQGDAVDRVLDEVLGLRDHVAALKVAGQYLADVLRAGSTGNHTASQLGALDRWGVAARKGS